MCASYELEGVDFCGRSHKSLRVRVHERVKQMIAHIRFRYYLVDIQNKAIH